MANQFKPETPADMVLKIEEWLSDKSRTVFMKRLREFMDWVDAWEASDSKRNERARKNRRELEQEIQHLDEATSRELKPYQIGGNDSPASRRSKGRKAQAIRAAFDEQAKPLLGRLAKVAAESPSPWDHLLAHEKADDSWKCPGLGRLGFHTTAKPGVDPGSPERLVLAFVRVAIAYDCGFDARRKPLTKAVLDEHEVVVAWDVMSHNWQCWAHILQDEWLKVRGDVERIAGVEPLDGADWSRPLSKIRIMNALGIDSPKAFNAFARRQGIKTITRSTHQICLKGLPQSQRNRLETA